MVRDSGGAAPTLGGVVVQVGAAGSLGALVVALAILAAGLTADQGPAA